LAGLSLQDVRKSFGAVDVIHGIDLDIPDGEFVVFVGPSGCGKSTLLRIISGLEDLSSGRVSIGGSDVTDMDPSERGVAMVFQSYALYPHMTARQNLGFGLRMGGMPKPEIAERVDRAAGIRALSGGQRQRVAIGRAIVQEPDVFLFDEPLSNLDAELRVQMRLEIAKLHNDLGATMIYVTHDQVEAMTLADRIVVLRGGRIEQQGSPIALYDDPDNAFVAGFIGSPRMNMLPAKVLRTSGAMVEVQVAAFPQLPLAMPARGARPLPGEAITFGIRPEHFADPETAPASFDAMVQVVEQLGGVSYLHVQGADGSQLTVQQKGHALAPVNAPVRLGFDPATCFLFDADGLRI
jgi:lactose/L-arabinose transport system ATP-binding protein